MDEKTGKNKIINFILDDNDSASESSLQNASSGNSTLGPLEDLTNYDFLIHDMFLDHFFP